MNRRSIILGVVLTLIHVATATVCVLISFGDIMSEFDQPNLSINVFAEALGYAADILLLPGRLLWTSWMSKHMPNFVEWIVFLANSGLWGFGIAFAINRLTRAWSRRGEPRGSCPSLDRNIYLRGNYLPASFDRKRR